MKINHLSFHFHEHFLHTGQKRSCFFIHLVDEKGKSGWGEVAPLPNFSKETMDECIHQFEQIKKIILEIDWKKKSYLEEITNLSLLPSLSFGLESALLSLLLPLSEYTVKVSALLMGSPKEILEKALFRKKEGFTSAKLKVGHLSFDEAFDLIQELKNKFRLRIDVNRAWKTSDSIDFFSKFPLNTFDYVEEPFQNPHDLKIFPHPLAVDESFPKDLSLKELESFPSLKAIIYKPMVQGGMLNCLPLYEWTKKRQISLVLSSSFESDLGLIHLASIAKRLSLSSPIGIGTYHELKTSVLKTPLQFVNSSVFVLSEPVPKIESIR